MPETLWSQPQQLRDLLSRAADLASGSGRALMESAGLSWQSLSAWKAGTRTPRPENIRVVGRVLLVRAEKLAALGQQLIEAADAEELARARVNQAAPAPLPLFEDAGA